ncbi:MAG: hypothetical protein EOO89_16165 [Pedobacter sp.]|nr:MAG: hypothetical protein EOO89_16165 [Pedobacter sp.]
MKVKLTPLNIVSSICLVASVMLFTTKTSPRPHHVDITAMLAWLSLLSALIFFISDLIFRRFILSLKKLWIVEGVLVIFIAVLILIITSSLK